MVQTTEKENQTLYLCGECGLGYVDSEIAKKCEDYCKKYNSCSLEITSRAILK